MSSGFPEKYNPEDPKDAAELLKLLEQDDTNTVDVLELLGNNSDIGDSSDEENDDLETVVAKPKKRIGKCYQICKEASTE